MKWALAWAVLIFILCAIQGKDIPHISFLELLEFDKFVHASLFFVLLLFGVRGLLLSGTAKKAAMLYCFLFCVLYGGSLELMQGAFFEGRSADIYDFIANSFGALMGLIFYNSFERMILARLIK